MTTYRELWHDHQKSWLKICDFPKRLGSEMVVVKAMYSLVSHGTEQLVTTKLLSEKTSQVMRIPYMKGDFANKFTYGYSLVGEVITGPSKLIGKNIHVLHPHQEIAFVNANEVFIVPEDIPSPVATLASNMETAVNAVWDAEINMGDRVLIIGYGVIGALISSLAVRYPGIKLTVLEKDNERFTKASEYGIPAVKSDESLESDYDVAFNCSGCESGLQIAIDKTITEGKVMELSWYGSKLVTLDLGNAFHYGRKRIISTQVGRIPASRHVNWSFKKRKKLVFELLKQPELEALTKCEIPFSSSPDFYMKLRKKQIKQLSTVINYNLQ